MFKVKFISFTLYASGEMEEDEVLTIECDTLEQAQDEMSKEQLGCNGQKVKVYLNDKFDHSYYVGDGVEEMVDYYQEFYF